MDGRDLVIIVIERLVIYSYSKLQLIGISHIFPRPLMTFWGRRILLFWYYDSFNASRCNRHLSLKFTTRASSKSLVMLTPALFVGQLTTAHAATIPIALRAILPAGDFITFNSSWSV
jgi:hypothetical protein